MDMVAVFRAYSHGEMDMPAGADGYLWSGQDADLMQVADSEVAVHSDGVDMAVGDRDFLAAHTGEAVVVQRFACYFGRAQELMGMGLALWCDSQAVSSSRFPGGLFLAYSIL